VPIGYESRTLQGVFVQFEYPAGLPYNPYFPSASTLYSMGMQASLPENFDLGCCKHPTRRALFIDIYYSYRNYWTTDPEDQLIEIMTTHPWGEVESPTQGSFSWGGTVQASYGTSMLGLQVGESVGLSYSYTVPALIEIQFWRMEPQSLVTATSVYNSQMAVCEYDDACWVIALSPIDSWRLRYMGLILISPYNVEELPHTIDGLQIELAVDNGKASTVDNSMHDGVYIIPVVDAYYADNVWLYAYADVIITYIFGDNSEASGNDAYLWFFAAS
jgi:hypothetical protein